MKNKKVWLVMMLLCLVLTACGKSDAEDIPKETMSGVTEPESSDETEEIAMTEETMKETESQVIADSEDEQETESQVIPESEENQEPESQKPIVQEQPSEKEGVKIPSGCVYTVSATGEVLETGDTFPDAPQKGDIYETEEYLYMYQREFSYSEGYSGDCSGWHAKVIDQTKEIFWRKL